MDRIANTREFSVGTGVGDFEDSETGAAYFDMSRYAGGIVHIAAGDNGNSATELTWYVLQSAGATPEPLFDKTGENAVTQTIPGTAEASGAAFPLPDECFGAGLIACKGDAALTISITGKS